MRVIFRCCLVLVVIAIAASCSDQISTSQGERRADVGAPVDSLVSEVVGDDVQEATGAELASTQPRADECPFTATNSTTTILESLAGDLRSSGESALANDVDDLAVKLADSEPTAEVLVQTMNVLPSAQAALAGRTDVSCLSILEGALGRMGAPSGADESNDAVALASAGDDLASVIQRGYRLPAADAACVAGNLEQSGETPEVSEIDEVDILVALSDCANQS